MLRTVIRSLRKSPPRLGLAHRCSCRRSTVSTWRFLIAGINPPKYEFTKSPSNYGDADSLCKRKLRVSTASLEAGETTTPEIRYSLWDLVAYFTRLGTFGFG